MTKAENKVFVAMSGGVDSSVTAALLKERSFEVRGVHIKMWSDPEIPCTTKEDRYDAMRVAAHLGIPFETWDFTDEYRRAVVDYMIREYAAGRTPNPDVMCNRHIKFGLFLRRALERGADFVAMGHYVRLRNTKKYEYTKDSEEKVSYIRKKFVFRSPLKLLRAKDLNKDQSYFLWTLTQEQLKHCLFPIGEYTKPEVREMARKFGLPTAEKPDSQGICFIGEIDMREFLRKYIPMRPGLIVTSGGRTIGEHEGLSFYTIGERHGLGIGGGIPYYVAEKDFSSNTLKVAEGPYDEKLFSSELIATDVNWVSDKAPRLPLKCEARIRYRQPLQEAVIKSRIKNQELRDRDKSLILNSNPLLLVRFSEPQRAVTPGQSVVFYSSEKMLGGGIILK